MIMLVAIYWPSFFFLLFATVACAFALAVVISKNIVHMAFYLVVSLTATAGLFFLAGADFVGAMQIMIYVGGTLVLLVFGVMLTSQAAFVSMQTRAGEWVVAAVVGSVLLALLCWAALSVDSWQGINRATAETEMAPARPTATRIGMSLLGIPVEQFERQRDESTALTGNRSSSAVAGYLLAFEIVAIHLLVVLVGAAYLARTRRSVARPATPGVKQHTS
jgi:NADH-quinone oxidoreductase subunit J